MLLIVFAMEAVKHIHEVRPRKDKRGVDLISNVLPFGRLWYGDANAVADAVGYVQHYSRSPSPPSFEGTDVESAKQNDQNATASLWV